MRAFIGFLVGNEVKKQLSQIQKEISKSGADIKFVEHHNFHLCLRFLGEIGENEVKRVKKALLEALKGQKKLNLELKGPGVFPNPEYIRVIWVGISGNLDAVVENINRELEKYGFAKPDRKFKAHITIGRVRSAKNKEKLARIIRSLPDLSHPFEVKQVCLFSSTLKTTGPIYNIVFSVDLV